MPDTRYRKVTKANELPRRMLLKTGALLFRRKWSCPGEVLIAGYADGGLSKWRRTFIDFHLASCERCRLTVAYLVKAQREPDPGMPPAELVQQAMGSGRQQSFPKRWRWATAGALAGIAILAVFPALLYRTERTGKALPVTSTVPLIAKSEPVLKPGSPASTHDVVRGLPSPHPVPTIISPRPEMIVATGRPEFMWKPVADSRRYEVQVVRSDGDLVWKGETESSVLQISPTPVLRSGTYFVWITAYLNDGQLAKSRLVRFQVKR